MLTAGRDGGLKSMELLGMLSIRITDEAFGRIKLCMQVIVFSKMVWETTHYMVSSKSLFNRTCFATRLIVGNSICFFIIKISYLYFTLT